MTQDPFAKPSFNTVPGTPCATDVRPLYIHQNLFIKHLNESKALNTAKTEFSMIYGISPATLIVLCVCACGWGDVHLGELLNGKFVLRGKPTLGELARCGGFRVELRAGRRGEVCSEGSVGFLVALDCRIKFQKRTTYTA